MTYPNISYSDLKSTAVEEIEVKALSLDLFALFIKKDGLTHQVFNNKSRPLYTDTLTEMRSLIKDIDRIPQDHVFLEQATGLYYQLEGDDGSTKTRIQLS